MLVSFKLLKNTLKFITCFLALLIYYKYHSDSRIQPQWRVYYNDASEIKIRPTIRADIKYILIWHQGYFDFLKKGQTVFTENRCTYNNCYVTTHRNMVNNDYANFHAILFSGKKITKVFVDGYLKLPMRRNRSQTYIFAMQQDSVTYPVCDEKFDNFFNLTWTYKLDSDIVWPHFQILKLDTNELVAPNINVQWPTKYNTRVVEAETKLNSKEYFAVWNYTQCETRTVTQDVAFKIKMHCQDDANIVDFIGACGYKECTHESKQDCLNILDGYSFYLALEVVEAEDYVSTEVLDAMQHYCVPVVFGGANYSRFLPPNSYIDIKELGIKPTAELMDYLSTDMVAYSQYFEWRTTFKIDSNRGEASAVCALCRTLNQGGERVQKDLRQWWNPDYKDACN